MAESVEIGKHVPNLGNYRIGSSEMVTEGNLVVPLQAKERDTLEASEEKDHSLSVLSAEHPTIGAPDQGLINGMNLNKAIQEMRANPWFNASFLLAFQSMMLEVIDLQSELHQKEAQNEIKIREELFATAKSSGELAKALMENQSQEQLIQAIGSFATATVSLGQFIQSTRNQGMASNKVKEKIDKQQQEIEKKEAAYNTAKTEENGERGADRIQDAAPDPNQLDGPRAKAAKEEWDKEKKKLEKLKHRESIDVQEELRHTDQQSQVLSEAYKSTINGVQGVLTSMIKTDSSVKEEMQKIYEGYMQVLNKFNETTAKARESASSDVVRLMDMLNKILESDFKAHALSGR